jgi:acetolactate synthase-1/2/3 large subunit
MTSPKLDRRKFFEGAAVTGVSALGLVTNAHAAVAPKVSPAGEATPAAVMPSFQVAAAETGTPPHAPAEAGVPGSDFMVDVIRSVGIDYIASNPAASFRGLHESVINYGGNKKPEFLTCMHEESAVAMAHGYFKTTGRLMGVLVHGTVGLQHATMAVYNAWCDRVPVMIIGGNHVDGAARAPGVPTYHAAQDIGAIVRDYTKWDDAPGSLQHFAESFARAAKMALTPPFGPVLLSVDGGLQEMTVSDRSGLRIPRFVMPSPPQADVNALREAAKLLVAATNPVIVVDRAARNQEGVRLLVELAELLQAPIVDQVARMNFPNTHYLHQTASARALIPEADVILGMELSDFWGVVNAYIDNGDHGGHGEHQPTAKPQCKLISISSVDLNTKSNYQDFQRFQPVDIAMAGDAQASLPTLIEAIKAVMPKDRAGVIANRAQAFKKMHRDNVERHRAAAASGWNASPISTARLSMEIYDQVKDMDWSLVSDDIFVSRFPNRLWKMEKHHQYLGGAGGYGMGYQAAAAVGAAIGNKALGRFTVNIQTDGDLMYAPGALWTAAHHDIPLLTVMHNNRGYHQEVMHVQRMSNRRNRRANLGKTSGPVGTSIENPNIDFAKLAASMGVWSAGPITSPSDLAPALKRAIAVVKSGRPALVDVITQPR